MSINEILDILMFAALCGAILIGFPVDEQAQTPDLVAELSSQGFDRMIAAGRTAPDVINVSRGILYAADDRGFGARARDWAEKIAAAYPA